MLRQYAFNLILLFILPLWVISCQKTPDFVVQTLSSAENCMEAHPDSALNLLKVSSINSIYPLVSDSRTL